MQAERQAYEARQDKVRRHRTNYLSLVIDGADQKGYGLPHFIRSTKADKCHKLLVKCVGVLEHAKENHLSLFTMTEEFATGANLVIEAVHRVLNEKSSDGDDSSDSFRSSEQLYLRE